GEAGDRLDAARVGVVQVRGEFACVEEVLPALACAVPDVDRLPVVIREAFGELAGADARGVDDANVVNVATGLTVRTHAADLARVLGDRETKRRPEDAGNHEATQGHGKDLAMNPAHCSSRLL